MINVKLNPFCRQLIAEVEMSRANVGAVLLAIYASKKIAECDSPTLRYGKTAAQATTGQQPTAVSKKSTFTRVLRTMRFILSLLGVTELCLIASIAASLIMRSILRLKLLNLSTAVENSVLTSRKSSFWDTIRTFSMYMIPTSACFAAFNYLLSELAIHVRRSTTTRLLSKFTTGRVYYQVVNAAQLQSITANNSSAEQLNIDSYPNPDQILTNDIEHFSYALSGLFSHMMRPIVDILVNAQRLYVTGGAFIPAVMGIYLVVTSNLLNYIRSPVADFTDGEQRLEGEYRSLIARIATSAEEIAALEGGKNEEANVLKSLHPLLQYSRRFAQFRCNMSFIDSVVARYWLMILGWRIVGMHFFEKQSNDPAQGETVFKDYQNMSKTMLALSNAVGELIMSGRDVVKVFAYGEKLAEFEDALDALIQQSEMPQPTGSVRANSAVGSVSCVVGNAIQGESAAAGLEMDSARGANVPPAEAPELQCAESVLEGLNQTSLAFENVSIVPPNHGDALYSSLNIVFRRQMHTIVTGENGTGKSSLLRVLAGVWPAGSGRVVRPVCGNSSVFTTRDSRARIPVLYLPQKPYMSLGTLRQQLVYPEILPDSIVNPELDADLQHILRLVHLSHLMHPACYRSASSTALDSVDAAGAADRIEESCDAAARCSAQGAGEAAETHVESPARTSASVLAVSADTGAVVERGYVLDSVVDWSEVLSGGEKQRLSLARLFYQRPLFALLDECTSAMSREIEEALLSACLTETDTTLIAITHSPHLRRHFKYELHLSKGKEYTFQQLKMI